MGDPILIRTIGLFLPITVLGVLLVWRKNNLRLMTGALLASLWTIPTLLLLNRLGIHFDWWQFEAQGGLLLGIPVDLFIGGVLLWGAIPAFAFPRLNIVLVIAIMFGITLILMAAAAPVVQLQSEWWLGEALGLSISLLPAQLLARWTANDQHLTKRVTLIALGYVGLTYWVLPTLILELTAGSWGSFIERPLWINSLGLQLLAVPAVMGLSAAQEFAGRGGGTPIPSDPPKRLVTSGVYAFVANPMQLSTSLTLIGWGVLLESPWVANAGVMVLIFGVGLGAWSTGQDLTERSGEAWTLYRRYVRNWWPRWRPWCPSVQADFPEPRLYVPEGCLPSSSLSSWITERRPVGLSVVAADDHPTRDRLHLTFDPGDGTPPEEGVAAFARALEHIHLGWALVGWTMRLPLVKPLLQLLVYAVAGGPVQIVPAKNRERPSETEILKGQNLPKLPVDNEDIA